MCVFTTMNTYGTRCGYMIWILIVLFVIITSVINGFIIMDINYHEQQRGAGSHASVHTYNRDFLMGIRASGLAVTTPVYHIPFECVKHTTHRGKRSGVRLRNRRRKFKPFLPVVTFGNVRSVVNKIDELRADCRFLHEYRDACILGITETWLDSTIGDGVVDINGFTMVRGDRTDASGKKRGGGVVLYVNDRWCNNIAIKSSICTPDLELLTISLRPYYLPREFTNVFATVLYIPPSADKEAAVSTVRNNATSLANCKPDSVHIIFGDVNHCSKEMKTSLHGFYQYVTCSTRKDNILDTFYSNIRHAYSSKQLAPLKSSDHFMIHMSPIYERKLKQTKPKMTNKTLMDDNSMEQLNSCFDSTDWDMFIADADGDVNELVEVVTSYITFCSESIFPTKTVKIYPNDKPWITSSLRKAIVDKHNSHGTGAIDYNHKQCSVNGSIQAAKNKYKHKVESMFNTNSTKDAWKGLQHLTGMTKTTKDPSILSEKGSADRLNEFYARFDNINFEAEQATTRSQLEQDVDNTDFSLSYDIVYKILSNLQLKSSGPDRISARLIKSCRFTLSYILHYMFELSLKTCIYPSIWKAGEIIPLPKKTIPLCDNDLRPVTLTAILSKCLERIGLSLLMPVVRNNFDPLQFAYLKGRSTDDAISCIIHYMSRHLDKKSSNTVRTLFIDYSSAFNTIQPHLMINKLNALGVPSYLQLWILNYLTNQPQYVRTKLEISGSITLNTGAPQGCVLSPVLFVLYTNDLQSNQDSIKIIKYADDTAVIGLITDNNSNDYIKSIEYVNNWCDVNYLNLNVSKTKEVIWDFRRNRIETEPVVINDRDVEVVDSYKYLGCVIDNKLKFDIHVREQILKANRRLYFIRVLNNIQISHNIIAKFYNTALSPVINYGAMAFYGLLSMKLRAELDRPRRICTRIMDYDKTVHLTDIKQVYNDSICKFVSKVLSNNTHPLFKEFTFLPHGIRLRSCLCRTNRYSNTVVPVAIGHYNINSCMQHRK